MPKTPKNALFCFICHVFLYNTHKLSPGYLIYLPSNANYYAKLLKSFLGNVSYSKQIGVLILFS